MASNKANKIKDFGYGFNAEGKLRKLDSNGQPGEDPFQFNVSDNHQECQKNYEALGDAVTEYIYQLLEEQEKLIRLQVPKDSKEGTFVFASQDYHKKEKLIVLIHGSGVVRAGQWARSLILNDSIKTGSQIPYIQKAIVSGYGVIVLNTNENYTCDNKPIPNSRNPEEHAIYVWRTYIATSSAKSIAIVAHSYGGVVTLAMAEAIEDFEKRVKAIAFTDSVHNFSHTKISKYLKKISRNWVSSKEPLDTPVMTSENNITMVSAEIYMAIHHLHGPLNFYMTPLDTPVMTSENNITMVSAEIYMAIHHLHGPLNFYMTPLDTPVMTSENNITMVSAGHLKHEMTSYSCMESVFSFIDDKLS